MEQAPAWLDALPVPAGVHREGRWLHVNQPMAALFGASSPGEIAGRSVFAFVHPSERARAEAELAPILARGEPLSVARIRLVRLDGGDLWARVESVPFAVDGGRLCVIVDMSELVREHEENMLLRAAFMQAREPIMLLDREGRVVHANPAACKLYGAKDEAELSGRNVAELRGGEKGDALWREIHGTVVREGRTWRGELSIPTPHGVEIVARRVAPVRDEEGEITHQVVIDHVITEERNRRQKLEQVQRLESLGVLAGGVAHDFNNLLAVIIGLAALAEREAPPTSRIRERMHGIIESCERGAELCRQLLAYAGQGGGYPEPLNLNELVMSLERLMHLSKATKVVLRLDLADNLPPIYADPAQLRQVVMNLVINASEAIGEKSGAITIRTGVMHADEAYLRTTFVPEEKLKPGRYVFLEVSDTGSGMDAATMARIFEPFFTTKFTGRGLGLSAVLGIVRAHHGAIKVYSEPGKGTTVKVLFPVMEKEDPTGEGERAAKRGSGLVLVVDDEESVREVAAIVLEEAGFKVLTAANGEEAVALMRAHAKEVVGVVLDLTMPGMDGVETLSALRRIREDVPVILSSGYNEEMAAARFAGKRLAGFLQKPYRPTELVEVALTAFGGARER